MTQPLRIALAGLGTVGAGVIKLLDANAKLIERRAGRPIEIAAVSARDRYRDRGVDLSRFEWADDASTLATREDVDAVVELIGGADGPALTLARLTLGNGKAFVTANKAMIAHHGVELAEAAEKADAALKYEAAVAGGIPVIKGLREGAAANEIGRVYGILNGTCNYILTQMEEAGHDFADVLADAQRLGYAEADPSFDIRHVIAADIAEAAALGFRVRLVGLAEAGAKGLFQRVHPCLVPVNHPLAHVVGSLNAVVAEGNFVGRLFFEGRGAGEGPTASAVVADLIDIARGEYGPAFAMPVASLAKLGRAPADQRRGRAYLRFTVADRPGVLAEITAAMRDAGVSIESLIQRGTAADGSALLVMVTHECPERAVSDALDRLEGSQSLTAKPLLMHILDL
jgi:homoserine dehydrogenase